ncbi:multidrug efflux MFS transporter EmrD [Biostraticola tofi]|nr:multidrug efflux MFS transporter EmrD [Biostraticola tofi]
MNNSRSLHLLLLLMALISVGQMAQTIYVPGMPAMALDLGVKKGALQQLMAAYLLVYGVSQLVYGPLSDRVGRRPVILAGMGIFWFGALVACFSSSLAMLTLACGIQGAGTGVGGVMARTLPRDLYEGMALRQANSLLNMGILISPLIAPLIGGVLADLVSWKACFAFLLVLSTAVTLIVWFKLPETRPAGVRPARWGLIALLRERQFNCYLVMLVGALAGIAAFEACSGVLLGQLGLSPGQVSLLFIMPVPAAFLGAWYAGRSDSPFGELMWKGVLSCLASGLLMWLPGWFGMMSVWTLLIPASLFFFGAGMLFPLATTGAMSPYPYLAGTAGALVGGIQNIGAGLVAGVSSLLPQTGQFSIGMLLTAMAILMLGCWLLLSQRLTAAAVTSPTSPQS